MCLSCGCCASGGSPTDDHDDDCNITLGDLTDAANAQGITLAQAAQNIVDAMAAMDDLETAVDVAPDAVLKALEAAPSTAVAAVIKSDEARQFTMSVAYPALRKDGHREFAGVDQVEKTAWSWMKRSRTVGLFHADGLIGDGTVVESSVHRGPDWVVKAVDGSEQVVHAGDWLVGVVWSDRAWNAIQKGEIDGFSIDGRARRRPQRASSAGLR